MSEEDNNAPERKKDHIELAFSSQVQAADLDEMSGHLPAQVGDRDALAHEIFDDMTKGGLLSPRDPAPVDAGHAQST